MNVFIKNSMVVKEYKNSKIKLSEITFSVVPKVSVLPSPNAAGDVQQAPKRGRKEWNLNLCYRDIVLPPKLPY